jgi:hypothetical protein
VLWHQGECHFIDAYARAPQDVALQSIEGSLNQRTRQAKLTGTLAGAGPNASVAFQGEGHFGASPAWTGDLRLADAGRTWAVHLEDKDGQIDATAEAPEWRADSLWNLVSFYCRWGTSAEAPANPPLLKGWKSHFTFHASSMTFYHAAMIGGGLTELKGEVSGLGERASVSGAGTLQEVPVADLSAAMGQPFLFDGKITAVARFEVAVASLPWNTLSGHAEATVREGRFRFPAATLKALARAHTAAYMKSKFPGFEEKGLPFRRLRVVAQAANGTLTVSSALLDAGSAKAAFAGKLDAARHGIDGYTRLQVRETNPELLKLLPGHYLFGAPGHEEVQPIYGRLQGSWSEWSVRAVSSGKIPATLQGSLRQALAQ